jgi:hypothetical protein
MKIVSAENTTSSRRIHIGNSSNKDNGSFCKVEEAIR